MVTVSYRTGEDKLFGKDKKSVSKVRKCMHNKKRSQTKTQSQIRTIIGLKMHR